MQIQFFSSVKLLAAVLLGWTLVGCGNSGGRFAISGKVTYDGQSVSQGTIGFAPTEAGKGKSVGADILDGRYEIPRSEGPTEGSYKVMIHAERPSGRKIRTDEGSTEVEDQMEQFIPWVYNQQTTLTADISGDRDDLDFVLEKPKKSKKKRRR